MVLPYDNQTTSLHLLESEVFRGDKICVKEEQTLVWGRVENIVGKGENACFQHFLLFPSCFQKAFFSQGC